MSNFELRPEQKAAANFCSRCSTLLLGKVGSGKTAAAISALKRRWVMAGRKRTLVLGSVRICNNVWGAELKNLMPQATYASCAAKKPEKRKEIIEGRADVVGINFENLAWLIKEYGDDIPRWFPNLIIDESSKLENPTSKTAQKFYTIAFKFEWRLPMTGTPRGNHLHDLWGNAYLADGGKALGRFKQAFYQKWFTPVERTFGTEWVPKLGAADEIYARLDDLVFVLPTEERPYKEIDYRIPINSAVMGCYTAMAGFLSDEDNEEPDLVYRDTTIIRGGSKVTTKLLQFSSGRVYADDGTVINVHDDKLDALAEIKAEAKGEPIMVVYQFKHELAAIQERFPDAVVADRDIVLEAWNYGEIKMLLIHPDSCGHGLNLQHGGYIQVWFTPDFDGEMYEQVVGRLNRPGVKDMVRVIRLIMENTEDERAYAIVDMKKAGNQEVFDR